VGVADEVEDKNGDVFTSTTDKGVCGASLANKRSTHKLENRSASSSSGMIHLSSTSSQGDLTCPRQHSYL